MKKIFLLLCLIFTAFTTASAQGPSTHLTFKGIPIDGSVKNFVSKLERKGFKYTDALNGVAMLNGDFATYKNCTIGIPFSSESDLIYSVSVLFPTMDKWSDLETNYSSIKRMLTTKYGDPTECVEQFHSFYQPTDDNMKMYELSMDRCEYRAVFKPKGGVISLSLVYQPILGASVILNYMDETNANAILSNAMDDL